MNQKKKKKKNMLIIFIAGAAIMLIICMFICMLISVFTPEQDMESESSSQPTMTEQDTESESSSQPTMTEQATETELSSQPTQTQKTISPQDKISKGQQAYINCLTCAQQPGWRVDLQSEPGINRGNIVDYLRHGDHIEIIDHKWIEEEDIWWYLIDGYNEYEKGGKFVSGWLASNRLSINPPEPYPNGTAWIEFEVGEEVGYGANIYSKPGYINTGGGGPFVGELRHGTEIEIIDSHWDKNSEYWFYTVVGVDKDTKEIVEGWLDGTFIVLTDPKK